MACSVSHYWESQVVNISRRFGVAVAPPSSTGVAPISTVAMVHELDGPELGTVSARVWFDDDAFLDVFERVKANGRHARRLEYAYQLMVDG